MKFQLYIDGELMDEARFDSEGYPAGAGIETGMFVAFDEEAECYIPYVATGGRRVVGIASETIRKGEIVQLYTDNGLIRRLRA